MLQKVLTKVFGSKHGRFLKTIQPEVEKINALEGATRELDDASLQAKTVEFRQRLDSGETLDDLLPEAFAVVREAGRRVLGMRHYDVQLIGGMVLHRGMIAEMKTGEGKTLVATLAAYLNALPGKGVHIVTVNDYLATRDSEWMGRVYKFLGLSVGVVKHDVNDQERQEAYNSDITYCTNNELGFDYLRDNMKFSLERMVQRGNNYCIVDEVDSILVDEARTPLIISGPAEVSTEKYNRINKIIPSLNQGAITQGGKYYELEDSGDYIVDEKSKSVALTETGVEACQRLLGLENLYAPENMELVHHINQALRAHVIFKKDVDYMIKDGQIVIVDEFTGRLMPGRRWSDGMHQAVEAKEGVKIERENQTLATITFQNYFRMYEKLSGMTGTADTEAVEFDKIYELEVAVIPTNRPLIRKEQPDVVYRTGDEKWNAVIDEIAEVQSSGQPCLVGTISIDSSEMLSRLLKKRNIRHVVLNAKYHQMEAEIIAQAGRKGAVTIATNMAGRGTDILLGGNPEALATDQLKAKGMKIGDTDPETWDQAFKAELELTRAACASEKEEVLALGGLYILGTERHESRRIDNQLRGRSGRQGDPGESRFFLSMDDDLMRIFAGDKVKSWLKTLGMEEGVPIESPMISRSIEKAQKQVEERNFDVRKHLLEYDDVNNKQRTEIYKMRRSILEGADQREWLFDRAGEILDYLVEEHLPGAVDPSEWDVELFRTKIGDQFGVVIPIDTDVLRSNGVDSVRDVVWKALETSYAEKEARVGADRMREYERHILMQIIDASWKDHLLAMDHLKDGISLRAYGQRDPLIEYKKESFELFGHLQERIENEAARFLFRLEPMTDEERQRATEERRKEQEAVFAAASRSAAGVQARGGIKQVQRTEAKVGRNDPCPCGSGKKYKKCHGAQGAAS
jgi:preprotein translocase subunit SecA